MLSMVFGMSDAAADAVANGAFQVYSWDELSDDIEIVDVNENQIYQYIKAERSMSIKKIVADVCSPREYDIVFRYFGFWSGMVHCRIGNCCRNWKRLSFME